MKLSYLVTGTGRSGTVYMARLLTSVGIQCGHEAIFDWQGIRGAERRLSGEQQIEASYASRTRWDNGKWVPLEKWLDTEEIQAESSYLAAPFLKEKLLEGVPVIHVVRDPIKVINSFCNYIGYFSSHVGTNSYEQFVYRTIPELQNPMPAYDRACMFWVKWNRMVEDSSPDLFYRVEDDPSAVLEFLGKSGAHFDEKDINSYKKSNSERFCLDKIQDSRIKSEFIDTGRRYGYKMKSEYLLM